MLAASAGLPIVAWLRLHRPDWAATLPLTTAERATEALLDRLMTVEAVGGAGVGVDRLLVRDGALWTEAVRIALDGVVDGAAMRAVHPAEGRLRAFAAGRMAQSLSGELAMLDPPADGDLRAGERRVARIALTGGKPRHGAMLVAVPDGDTAGAGDHAPAVLRIVGSGSGMYRADPVYCRIPEGWRVDALAEGVASFNIVTDPDGDRFNVRCGQPGDVANRIDLIGGTPLWAEVTGDVDLFAGPPLARTSRAEGALCIRKIGTRIWSRAPPRCRSGSTISADARTGSCSIGGVSRCSPPLPTSPGPARRIARTIR